MVIGIAVAKTGTPPAITWIVGPATSAFVALLLRTGHFWFDVRKDRREELTSLRETLGARDAVNVRRGELARRWPEAGRPGSVHEELNDLDEHRRYLTAAIKQYELLAIAPVAPDATTGLTQEKVRVEDLSRLLDESQAASGELTEDGWLRRGHAAIRARRFMEAVQSYEQALHLNPQSDGAHFARGYAFAQQRRDAEALDAYNAALGIRPRLHLYLLRRAVSLARLGRTSEAESDIALAQTMGTDAPAVVYAYACALAQLGQFESALRLIEGTLYSDTLDIATIRSDIDLKPMRDDSVFGGRLEEVIQAKPTVPWPSP